MAEEAKVENTNISEEFEELAEKQTVGLSDESIREITDAINDDNQEDPVDVVNELSVSDTVDLLHKLPADDRQALVDNDEIEIDPVVFSYLDEDVQRTTLSKMSAKQVADTWSTPPGRESRSGRS